MTKTAFDSLPVRTLSGAVLIAIVAGAALLSPYSFAALLVVICVGGMHEFYKLAERTCAKPQKRLGIAGGGLAVAASFLLAGGFTGYPVGVVLGAGFILFFAVFAAELYRKTENPIVNIATTLTGMIYIALPLSMFFFLAMFPVNAAGISAGQSIGAMHYKPWLVLCYFFIVWANDIGAYLVGIAFGRHRLFERISPKKSWEGFFGGLIAAVGVGVLCGYLLGGDAACKNMLFWGGLAAVAVVSGVLGDLVESMFKRSAGVKDSGAIMPGHGGFLDRFDALFYSIPFVFLYFIIFAS